MVRELLGDKISKISSVKGGRSEPMTRPKRIHRFFSWRGAFVGCRKGALLNIVPKTIMTPHGNSCSQDNNDTTRELRGPRRESPLHHTSAVPRHRTL